MTEKLDQNRVGTSADPEVVDTNIGKPTEKEFLLLSLRPLHEK